MGGVYAIEAAAREPVSLSSTLAFGCADLHPEAEVTNADFNAAIGDLPWSIAEVAPSLGVRGFMTSLKLERVAS